MKGKKPGIPNFRLRKIISIVLTFAVLASIMMIPVAFAADDVDCTHECGSECYAAPEGHECSEDEGCTQINAEEAGDESADGETPIEWTCGALISVCSHTNTSDCQMCLMGGS